MPFRRLARTDRFSPKKQEFTFDRPPAKRSIPALPARRKRPAVELKRKKKL